MKGIIRSLFLAAMLLAVPMALSLTVHAASGSVEICKGSGGTAMDKDGNPTTSNDSFSYCKPAGGKTLAGNDGFFKTIANTLIFIAGAIAVLVLIIGGINYVTSTGDAARVKRAKDTVLYAIVGLIVVILAYAIVNFVINNIK